MPTHGDSPLNQTSVRLEECVWPFKAACDELSRGE